MGIRVKAAVGFRTCSAAFRERDGETVGKLTTCQARHVLCRSEPPRGVDVLANLFSTQKERFASKLAPTAYGKAHLGPIGTAGTAFGIAQWRYFE